jgi:uncharacterized membrane protein YdjX (TVP38/TMEM64 family)
MLSFGAWAPLVYLVIYGQPLVPLPVSVLAISGGLAFGSLWGTLAALGGGSLRACTQFGVARSLGRDAVKKLLQGRIAALNQTIRGQGFSVVLLIRVIPNLPYDMQNYLLGCSDVRFGPYALATFLGIIPSSFAFAYLGNSLTDHGQAWKLLLAILLVIGMVVGPRRWKARQDRSPLPG